MAFPVGWPPRRQTEGNGSLRFYIEGVASAAFADNAFLFSGQPGVSAWIPLPFVRPGGDVSTGAPPTVVPEFAGGGQIDLGAPTPMFWSTMIRVVNLGAGAGIGDLEISFNGVDVHGKVWNSDSAANGALGYQTTNEFLYERCEAGIAVRGANGGVAVPYRIEAW